MQDMQVQNVGIGDVEERASERGSIEQVKMQDVGGEGERESNVAINK